ncbi:MAG: CDC27 family protein [Deltaproteobacteria bacterium]|nr:CDC27 family protein [Deltaproteobacteria bacterium]
MRVRVALSIVLTTALAGQAFAGDKAAGEAAFLQAKDLMKAGKVAEACAAFEKSQAADPQLGTEYNLATCYEKLGRLASAWTEFRELAQRDSNAARKADSQKHADAIQPRLIKLLISVRAPVAGLVVSRNGADVSSSVGIESPVDPGEYELSAQAPGHKPWSVKVTAQQEGGTVQVTVPELEKLPVDVTKPVDRTMEPIPPAGGLGGGVVTGPAPKSSRKLIGLSVGGAGLAATGVGLFFGSRAMSKWNDAKTLCPNKTCAPENQTAGDKLVDDAKSAGTISTVLVGVGVAAVAAGVVLYVTAPKGGAVEHAGLQVSPMVGPDGFAVAASGHF